MSDYLNPIPLYPEHLKNLTKSRIFIGNQNHDLMSVYRIKTTPRLLNQESRPCDEYLSEFRSYDENLQESRPSDECLPEFMPFDEYLPESRPYDEYLPESRPFDEYLPESRPYDEYLQESRPYGYESRPFEEYLPESRPSDECLPEYRPYDECSPESLSSNECLPESGSDVRRRKSSSFGGSKYNKTAVLNILGPTRRISPQKGERGISSEPDKYIRIAMRRPVFLVLKFIRSGQESKLVCLL
ncbi:unnamed protein product [Mytilus coruscus]|uniref:Uncharacterized protein n=1 Tax=Mytilus coruscus TaxID=42192 RepID=A0A6J8ETL2_MYTCO|nr:unnamed protein product [Mytilus coruscus]